LATIDVRKFKGDQIVVHFGGELTSVDAYTFANSLVSFADTVREVNSLVNPGQKIDVRLDAVGPGSFKAVIRQVRRDIGSLFESAPQNVFWILAALFIEQSIEGETTTEITDNEVIITRGKESIIVSREVFEHTENVKRSENVQRNIRRTFETIEKDEAVTEFGLTPEISDPRPLVSIPRDDFSNLTKLPEVIQPSEHRRRWTEKAQLIVLKAWINASKRKWAFEWNQVPISAFLRDEEFLSRVKNHEIRFGNGDVIDVEIDFYQDYDAERKVWITDVSTYSISRVFAFDPIGGERLVF